MRAPPPGPYALDRMAHDRAPFVGAIVGEGLARLEPPRVDAVLGQPAHHRERSPPRQVEVRRPAARVVSVPVDGLHDEGILHKNITPRTITVDEGLTSVAIFESALRLVHTARNGRGHTGACPRCVNSHKLYAPYVALRCGSTHATHDGFGGPFFGMLIFTPLGCGSVDKQPRVAQPVSEEGLKLPESTLVRLQECADEYAPRLPSPTYKLEFAIEAGGDGQVLKVAKAEMDPFNRDVATCMMLPLRAMTVPVSDLRARSGPAVSKKTQTPAARGQVGFVFIPAAFAAVAELVLVSAGVTFVFAIGVKLVEALAKDIEDVLDEQGKNRRYCNERLTQCLATPIQGIPGSIKGSSLCLWCRQKCIAYNGVWPDKVLWIGKRWLPCK
jgi:hypothetical protein